MIVVQGDVSHLSVDEKVDIMLDVALTLSDGKCGDTLALLAGSMIKGTGRMAKPGCERRALIEARDAMSKSFNDIVEGLDEFVKQRAAQ